jgi:predicted GIY-YIG superfamily endonuclease
VRCADDSLYTGIARDVARRFKQHNNGTASRYTRSRLPVELVYQEAQPDQSSALKREAAIKAMDRREKLAMAQPKKNRRRTDRDRSAALRCRTTNAQVTNHRSPPHTPLGDL